MKQVLHDRQTWNTRERHDAGIYSRGRGKSNAESDEISRNRQQNENETMLKIARDKLNYKITLTETNGKF